jgi:RNA polymerase sigma-70 factor (ECF subfamily)
VEDIYVQAGQAGLGADIFEQGLDARIVAAIDALPEEYRDVLVLSDLGDLNYAEIAQVVEVPVGTVKSRLFRARRRLQESLIDFAAEGGRPTEGSA